MQRFIVNVVLLVVLQFVSVASAGEIRVGAGIDAVMEAMRQARYTRTQLEMLVTRESNSNIVMWSVDRGALIVVYSTETRIVSGLSFFVCDDRPKAMRMEWDFTVRAFDPETGIMTIATKSPVGEGAPRP